MDNGAESYYRFLAGDDSAFEEILINYRDGLMLYVLGFVKDFHTAEELCEEVFFKLAVRRPRFNGASSFKSWLYAVGRNSAISLMRKRNRRREVSITDAAESPDRLCLEQSYLQNERRRTLYACLLKLKEEYRDVLMLSFFEGLSNEQTAKIMHKNKRQVENLLYRAKKALKQQMLEEGFVYEEL